MTEPSMRVPAHRLHADLGARFAPIAGWEVPLHYGDPPAEAGHLAASVGVADATARGKIDVRGDVDRLIVPAADGVLAARISETWALLLTEPGEAGGRIEELERWAGASAMATDATHMYAAFVLAGPRVLDALVRTTEFDAGSLAPGAAAGAPLAGVRSVLVRRDLPGTVLEAYVASEYGRHVFETLHEVARRLGGGAVGWKPLGDWGWAPC